MLDSNTRCWHRRIVKQSHRCRLLLTLVDAEHAAGLRDNRRNERHVDGAGTDGQDIDGDAADGGHVCEPAEIPMQHMDSSFSNLIY